MLLFTPSPDVADILHTLLDVHERRVGQCEADNPSAGSGPALSNRRHAVRCALADLELPGYFSQLDPHPRQTANEQLQTLEQAGLLQLRWLPGERGNLLETVTLIPDQAAAIFQLLERTPLAARRARLADMLLGERFRFAEWRRRAVQRCLAQLKASKSPAPFSLTDEVFNQDLLTALAALDDVQEETPYRVFSVRVFNDSKRFEDLMGALARLAKQGRLEWRGLPTAEVLRELNLVANPGHLYLHGPWQLVDELGQVMSLAEFQPSVGIPAAQAARLRRVTVEARRVVCVENPTAFYEYVRYAGQGAAALCLWGNPSPACRHLLRCLAASLTEDVPLLVWADLDYGGLNILAQLRAQVSRRFAPCRMDVETLEAHAAWARPLSRGDVRNLKRLSRHAELSDVQPLIAHMLRRGLKLEQEAILLRPDFDSRPRVR